MKDYIDLAILKVILAIGIIVFYGMVYIVGKSLGA